MRYFFAFIVWALLPIQLSAADFINLQSREGLMMAIIQDKFSFDFSNIKGATLVNNEDTTFKGLLIELKPKVVASLTKMTADGYNKEIMIIFNNKVISATIIREPLSAHILFTGISLADAQTFLLMLNNQKVEAEKKEQKEAFAA